MLPRNSSFFCSAGLSPILRLTRGAEIIVATGREAFMLRGREALRRIVEALVRARRVTPGDAVSVTRLFDAGWPGSTAALSSAARAQRVYAAISRLRRLGMSGIIEKNGDGYFIDTRWRVEVDAAPHLDEPYGIFGAA
jgi:hypothetical protein